MNTSIFLDRSEDLPETKVKILKADQPGAKPFAVMDLIEDSGSSVALYLRPDKALPFLVQLEDQLEAAIMEYANRDGMEALNKLRKEMMEVESA